MLPLSAGLCDNVIVPVLRADLNIFDLDSWRCPPAVVELSFAASAISTSSSSCENVSFGDVTASSSLMVISGGCIDVVVVVVAVVLGADVVLLILSSVLVTAEEGFAGVADAGSGSTGSGGESPDIDVCVDEWRARVCVLGFISDSTSLGLLIRKSSDTPSSSSPNLVLFSVVPDASDFELLRFTLGRRVLLSIFSLK